MDLVVEEKASEVECVVCTMAGRLSWESICGKIGLRERGEWVADQTGERAHDSTAVKRHPI